MAVPVVGTFASIFVKPSQVLDLATWKLNLPSGSQQVTHPGESGERVPLAAHRDAEPRHLRQAACDHQRAGFPCRSMIDAGARSLSMSIRARRS